METRISVQQVDKKFYCLVEAPALGDDAFTIRRTGYFTGLHFQMEGRVEMMRVLVEFENLPIVAGELGRDWNEVVIEQLLVREQEIRLQLREKWQKYLSEMAGRATLEDESLSGYYLEQVHGSLERSMAEYNCVLGALIIMRSPRRDTPII